MIESTHEERVIREIGKSYSVTLNKKQCLRDGFKEGDKVKITIMKYDDTDKCPYCHHTIN